MKFLVSNLIQELNIKGIIYLFTQTVIQSEAKNLGNTKVDVNVNATEILPPYGRLNDKLGVNKYIVSNINIIHRLWFYNH